jgi:hypothetical protein
MTGLTVVRRARFASRALLGRWAEEYCPTAQLGRQETVSWLEREGFRGFTARARR